jgi:hypothetical protein
VAGGEEGGVDADEDEDEAGRAEDVGRGCRRGLPRGRFSFCACIGSTSRALALGRCLRPERLHPLRINSRVWAAGRGIEESVFRRLYLDVAVAGGLSWRFRFATSGGAEAEAAAAASFLPTAWRSLCVFGRDAGSAGVLSRGVGILIPRVETRFGHGDS